MEPARPTARPCDGPGSIEALPKERKENDGQIRARGDGKGQADEESDVCVGPKADGKEDGDGADDECRDARDPHFLTGLLLRAMVDDVREEIVRERGTRTDRQAGDDGEDGGERHGADEGEEDIAADILGEQGSGHVAAAVFADEIRDRAGWPRRSRRTSS